ncbi:phage portal protein [Weizmannia sp. FSL K6-0777]|uniref:phage portal protein n=1 Tax=Heyndrickxia TaxID=2837504 RepID=UPI002E20E6D0|nr:phage portal protein [Weizmannia sp. CD-2023]MED4977212.1 phage portal protein [Weizmannia sp. CD-2023]
MQEFMSAIKTSGISGDLVSRIIEAHEPDHDRMVNLYQRYKAEIDGVPILQRQPIEYEDFETGAIRRIDNKVNNRLNNSFDSDIVDTKVGYLFGHPITYETDKDSTLKKLIEEFNLRNNIEDKDSEWGKKAAICGYGARLAYVDPEGKERVLNINPWEVVILSESDITEPSYALRYYKVIDFQNGNRAELHKAEFYDEKNVYFFIANDGANYSLVDQRPHLFDFCPLYGLPNNEELKGDAEKVLSLIDAYDRTLSDASNEIEQYRLAYLILKGAGADEETLENLKKTGIFELFDEKEDVKYLTKDINDTMIENHLDRLEENILRFAKSVNFQDEKFAGNISGVAMKFKLMALENKCITMERKMTAALRYQFKVLCSAWAKRGLAGADDYLNVWFGFKRNLPANILEEAQTTAALKGFVSEKTRLSLLSFVDDPEYEMEEIQNEADNLVNLDGVIDSEQSKQVSRAD